MPRFQILTALGSAVGRRGYSSFQTHPSLSVYTWLPSATVDGNRERISSRTAKLKFADRSSAVRVEPLGHAASRLQMNTIPKDVQELLAELNLDKKGITQIQGEMSWFPRSDSQTNEHIQTGVTFSQEERNEFEDRQRIMVGDDLERARSAMPAIRNFFSRELAAVNSSIQHDIAQYGPVSEQGIRVFTELNFREVVLCWLKMMDPVIKHTENGERILSMTEIAPHGTYYGKGMLEFFRGAASSGATDNYNPYSSLQHVCTTAVLQSVQAGVGVELFEEIARSVLKRPEFAHGLAIVDVTRAVTDEVAAQTQARYRVGDALVSDVDETASSEQQENLSPSPQR